MAKDKNPFMEYQRAWALFGPGSDIKPMLPIPGTPTLPSIDPPSESTQNTQEENTQNTQE